MKTIKQLGAAFKIEYPDYRDLTDEQAGKIAKKAYPDDYADFVDISPKVVGLLEYYDPKIGRFRAWWRRLKSEGRNKLQSQLTPELLSIIEQGAMLEDAAISSKKKAEELQSFIVYNQYLLFELQQKANLLESVTKKDRTVETEQIIQRDTALSFNYRAELQATTDNQIRIAESLSHIRIHEFGEMESIKLNHELKKMNEQVRLALIAKALSSHQRVLLVQELIDGLYKQIEDVEQTHLSPATKRRMIEDREEIINHFKGYRNAEGNRLFQTD